ncbi:MAG: lipocalin family protein [Gammaproteobacteria bacterium]
MSARQLLLALGLGVVLSGCQSVSREPPDTVTGLDLERFMGFRDGAFDGPLKVYRPTGFVSPDDNAVWGMQFVWPNRSEFLVLYVDEDYQRTVIGRSKRDYVWLMARRPDLGEAEYAELAQVVADAGYDASELQRVPQRWPEAGGE